MGPGAFVAALEVASHRDADSTTVCGKPSEAFLQECIAGMIPENEQMSDYTNIIVSSLFLEAADILRRILSSRRTFMSLMPYCCDGPDRRRY